MRVDLSETPIGAVLPHFAPPTTALKAGAKWPLEPSIKMYGDPAVAAGWFKKYGSYAIPNLNLDMFPRMLAKIAHCAAVATFGIDELEPFLLPIIRGDMREMSRFIGSQHKIDPPARPGRAYQVEMRITHSGHYLALIRFFTYWATPTYLAYAGHQKGQAPRTFEP
jgi:hypothetical protein